MQDQKCKESAHDMPRPLNAFLIFSKRHREIVREKYPDLENRDVTKMLGRWWASLDKKAKACYFGLAKKYKEAYCSENPKFKWYKVPVPPATLRILPSRSGKSTEKRNVTSHEDDELEITNNESTDLDKKSPNESVSEIDSKPLSMSTPVKLSDIAIINVNKSEAISSPVEDKSHNSLDSPKSNREDSVQDLQNALTETTRIFEDDFEGKERLQHESVVNDQMTNQDVIDQTVDNRFSKDDDGYKKNGLDVKKRHQAVEGLIENKRQRIDSPDRSDEGNNAPCSQDPGSSLEESTVTMFDESKPNDDNIQHDITIESEPNVKPNDTSTPSNNANKKFKAADFDLDLILRDLPAQSLEKFEEKKREKNRNKKKLPPDILDDAAIINAVH